MTLFKYWVTSPYVKLDPDILYKITHFSQSVQTSDRMKELALEVMDAIDFQVRCCLPTDLSAFPTICLVDNEFSGFSKAILFKDTTSRI